MLLGWMPGDLGFDLRLGLLTVSFQRYELPESGIVAHPPRSLGALPVARLPDGRFLLPVAKREAFWIGVSSKADPPFLVWVQARFSDGEASALAEGTRIVPSGLRIVGWPIGGGSISVLSRTGQGATAAVRSISILARHANLHRGEPAEAVVDLVDYVRFSKETSLAPPEKLNPEAGYKGDLLP